MKTIILLGVAVGVWASATASAQSTSMESEIQVAEERIRGAQAAHLHLISPENFQKATAKLDEAKAKFKSGGKIEDIRRRLRESQAAFEKAQSFEEVGMLLLEDALAAWSDALAANAPEHAPKEWEIAKDAMDRAGREIEDGDHDGARDKAAKAREVIRLAEFEAIRTDLLGKAKELRAEALERDAGDRAAITLENAESLLRQAEQVLQSDRYQRGEASALASQAAAQYRHAANIARTQAQVERNSKVEVERLVLTHERLLSRVAEALGVDVSFQEGLDPATERIVAAGASLVRDRASLQEELGVRSEELVLARRRADSLDVRLALLEDREQSISAALRAQQERRRKIQQIRQLFTPAEGSCLEAADGLVIRLGGIAFPVGSSEIQPQDFPLLTKVQEALRKFPSSPVVIEGHTDSQGDADFNHALSERRAEAVSTYLIANMGGDESRFTSIGYGESQPVATNETKEGRAQNRRIDIRIALSEMEVR